MLFAPLFLFTILAEALAIRARGGRYPWGNTGVSVMLAAGHVISQAAVHGLIFSVIADGVYSVRLATIPVPFGHWPALDALFVLTELGPAALALGIAHRCGYYPFPRGDRECANFSGRWAPSTASSSRAKS
jgi:hypothetical protein